MSRTHRLLILLILLVGSITPAGRMSAAPRAVETTTSADPPLNQYWVRRTYYSDSTFSIVVGYYEKYCNGTKETYGQQTEYVELYAEPCNDPLAAR